MQISIITYDHWVRSRPVLLAALALLLLPAPAVTEAGTPPFSVRRGTDQMESLKKGEVVKNMHYISDRFWEIRKEIKD